MSNIGKHRHHLPQLDGKLFLTDGGIETTLIFHEGLELPLLRRLRPAAATSAGRDALRKYYERYVAIARRQSASASCSRARPGAPAPTGARSSAIRKQALAHANRDAIALMVELRQRLRVARHADA